jgi:uncharacterized RDD family membrane protein YckC
MEDVLDQSLFQPDKPSVTYGGFWQRFGALILDGIILSPVSFGLTYLNITSWKSSLVLIIITLVGIAYKPYMESTYGATLGKMALKLTVTNLEFEKASLGDILLRNIFQIVPQLITLFFTISIYNDPGFESVSGFREFSTFSQQFHVLQYINYAAGLILMIDGIMLAADQRKRSLHDRIGGTLVINKT